MADCDNIARTAGWRDVSQFPSAASLVIPKGFAGERVKPPLCCSTVVM